MTFDDCGYAGAAICSQKLNTNQHLAFASRQQPQLVLSCENEVPSFSINSCIFQQEVHWNMVNLQE